MLNDFYFYLYSFFGPVYIHSFIGLYPIITCIYELCRNM